MFDVSKIQTKLYGVVGFRQPLDPDFAILDAANQVSRSGEFVTENPYCKINYLKDNQDFIGISDADFNEKLKEMQQASIISVCHQVFIKPDYIDRQVLYPYPQNRVDTDTLPNGLITHKFQLDLTKNVAFEITRILLDFDGSGDLELRLFNTAQDAPIFSETITIAPGETHKAVDLNWIVDNTGDTYKGDFYLGYRNNTGAFGTLKPFERNYENSDIKSNITHFHVIEYFFPNHTTDTLPDLDDETSYDESSGLNPDITVYDDFTDWVTQGERLFARAILLDLQIKCIEMYLASLRSNANERDSKRMIQLLIATIEGTTDEAVVKITGLRPQLSRSISQIRKQVKKLQDGMTPQRVMVGTLE